MSSSAPWKSASEPERLSLTLGSKLEDNNYCGFVVQKRVFLACRLSVGAARKLSHTKSAFSISAYNDFFNSSHFFLGTS